MLKVMALMVELINSNFTHKLQFKDVIMKRTLSQILMRLLGKLLFSMKDQQDRTLTSISEVLLIQTHTVNF